MQRSILYTLKLDSKIKPNGYFASSYIRVLEDNLFSAYEPGLIFMRDNAPYVPHNRSRID